MSVEYSQSFIGTNWGRLECDVVTSLLERSVLTVHKFQKGSASPGTEIIIYDYIIIYISFSFAKFSNFDSYLSVLFLNYSNREAWSISFELVSKSASSCNLPDLPEDLFLPGV